MSEAAKHTPPPWTANGPHVFRDGCCLAVCDTDVWMPAVNEANAALIVKAANLHEDLLGMLSRFISTQEAHYGDATALHLAMIDVAATARKVIARAAMAA